MRLTLNNHFLTLVVALTCVAGLPVAIAAPDNSITPSPIDTKPGRPIEKGQPNPNMESMQISPAPEDDQHLRRMPLKNLYFDRSVNVSLGYAVGVFDTDEQFEKTWVVGLQRTNYNSEDTAQEYGIEFNRLNLIGLNVGYKWMCCHRYSYEPYYKAAVAAYYDPSDALANVINFERYLLRGSIGFENLFDRRRRMRVEMSAGLGPQGLTLGTQFIYAIPD